MADTPPPPPPRAVRFEMLVTGRISDHDRMTWLYVHLDYCDRCDINEKAGGPVIVMKIAAFAPAREHLKRRKNEHENPPDTITKLCPACLEQLAREVRTYGAAQFQAS